ncbi:LlaJI family restriction endonuclease [Clostridium estertheticum]|uniref:LlaJI family restriction endonuclease n=1 Tax=Clostridium estertheticum TaxID=238834 RepID=UPI001C0DE882|nr:LlaJI family restriction endonuclease [Clostridium estertheticum]MBU3217443.1 LlaJI family restriction endonuclease [Clostridium estertheticum]WAG56621.1 LlaJI family restriction endonuclease [Clostridium estertheticum]
MIKYFYEEYGYSKDDLYGILDIFHKLTERGILKRCKSKSGDKYKFKYVGIVATQQHIISILPKYLEIKTKGQELLITKKIIKLFKKIDPSKVSNEEDLYFDTNLGNDDSNEIIIADYLLQDYFLNGIYNKECTYIDMNSNNDIDWDETINGIDPILIEDQPIYFNTYHTISDIDTYNQVTKIHAWAMNYCYMKYADILGYDSYYVESLVTDVPNYDSWINLINIELSEIYDDRNVALLKSLINLIYNKLNSDESNDITFYGTSSFHIIWEYILSYLCDNNYNQICKDMDKAKFYSLQNEYIATKTKTLEPDILKLEECDNSKTLFILDAKYYNFKLYNASYEHSPGIEDIIKQFMYEEVLRKKYLSNSNMKTYNAFVFPADDSTIDIMKPIGKLKIDYFGGKEIILILANAEKIFDAFIKDKKFGNLLGLLGCEISK